MWGIRLFAVTTVTTPKSLDIACFFGSNGLFCAVTKQWQAIKNSDKPKVTGRVVVRRCIGGAKIYNHVRPWAFALCHVAGALSVTMEIYRPPNKRGFSLRKWRKCQKYKKSFLVGKWSKKSKLICFISRLQGSTRRFNCVCAMHFEIIERLRTALKGL